MKYWAIVVSTPCIYVRYLQSSATGDWYNQILVTSKYPFTDCYRSVCVKLYRSQKVCKQGSTLGLWKWSRQMLQTRNCLSICRTTGLVLPVSRLAMVTDIHRHSWGPGHTLTCLTHTQAWLIIHKNHYNYSTKWSMSLEGSLLTWIVSKATLTALNLSLEPLFLDSIFSKTNKQINKIFKKNSR